MTSPALVRIVPNPGLIVPNPATRRPLAGEGEMLELSPYWRRRLAEGCCSVEDQPQPSEKSAVESKAPRVLKPDPASAKSENPHK